MDIELYKIEKDIRNKVKSKNYKLKEISKYNYLKNGLLYAKKQGYINQENQTKILIGAGII